MARYECLTITKRGIVRGKTHIENTVYEMLGTTDTGETRLIDVIEVDQYARKKVVRHQAKRMALPEGKYISETAWGDTQKAKHLKMVAKWLDLPVKESYSGWYGTSHGETRFIKN